MAPAETRETRRPAASIERRALRDGVHEAVLEILLENRIRPGEALSIDGLARELGVSPTPVREALVQLEHTGLVTRTALKGYRVSPPLSSARMHQLMTARAVIEVAAVKLAVPVSPDGIEVLEQANDQHYAACRRVLRSVDHESGAVEWSVLRGYYTADWEFHLTLLRAAGNPFLLEMAQELAPQIHRMRQSMRQGSIDVEQAHEEHEAILAAVRTGKPDVAAEAMQRHLSAVAERSSAGD